MRFSFNFIVISSTSASQLHHHSTGRLPHLMKTRCVRKCCERLIDHALFPKIQAGNARWIVNNTMWAFMATSSVHLNGMAFGNVVSVANYTLAGHAGVPVLYTSPMDTSMQDIAHNPNCSLTFSAQTNGYCTSIDVDPEDPLCLRLTLSGVLTNFTDEASPALKKHLFDVHPEFKSWPKNHDWQVWYLDIQHVWLIDMFGGAANISPQAYWSYKF